MRVEADLEVIARGAAVLREDAVGRDARALERIVDDLAALFGDERDDDVERRVVVAVVELDDARPGHAAHVLAARVGVGLDLLVQRAALRLRHGDRPRRCAIPA